MAPSIPLHGITDDGPSTVKFYNSLASEHKVTLQLESCQADRRHDSAKYAGEGGSGNQMSAMNRRNFIKASICFSVAPLGIGWKKEVSAFEFTEAEIKAFYQATRTIFFSEREYQGEIVRGRRFYSMHLLNLNTRFFDIPATIADLRSIVANEDLAMIERDSLIVLQSLDYRVHLIGCGVMLAGVITPALKEALWVRLQRGSWVSPQLAATAYLSDPNFVEKGVRLIKDPDAPWKSVLSVAHLLGRKRIRQLPFWQRARIVRWNRQDAGTAGGLAFLWHATFSVYRQNYPWRLPSLIHCVCLAVMQPNLN
jgi:hypothetical protein